MHRLERLLHVREEAAAYLELTGLRTMGQNCPFRLGFLASEHGPNGSVVVFDASPWGDLPEGLRGDGPGDQPGAPRQGGLSPMPPLGPMSACGPQRVGHEAPVIFGMDAGQ